jgi:hypothetical protein
MAKSIPKRKGQCVYCGKNGPLTRDHLPPECLFGKPLPKNLITVPCCLDCNGKASRDDEYLRSVFALHGGLSNDPDVDKIRPAFERSLTNPQKVGFALALLGTVRDVYLRAPSGLYLGKGKAFSPDLSRLDKIMQRIAKGIFYHEMKTRLPDSYAIHIYPVSGLISIKDKRIKDINNVLLPQLIASGVKIIGEGVFAYAHVHESADKNVSMWLLVFYRTVSFYAFTVQISR